MNVHFPQDELGRSEGYNIVNADEQFVVPTSGDPIRGLIQVSCPEDMLFILYSVTFILQALRVFLTNSGSVPHRHRCV